MKENDIIDESVLIEAIYKERKKIKCLCGEIILVPIDPCPFYCAKCKTRFLHDKKNEVVRLLDSGVEQVELVE